MRVLILSDFHINTFTKKNINDILNFLEKLEGINLVIIAGDISSNIEELKMILYILGEKIESDNYVMIPGNHDIWGTKYINGISMLKYKQEIPEAVSETKFHYLPNQPIIIEDTAIIGNIGWYDYSLRNKKFDNFLKNINVKYKDKSIYGLEWNDINYANWGMNDIEITDFLLKELIDDYKKVENINNKIIVTHHIPFREGVIYKNDITWDYFSAYMGSEKFGEQISKWDITLAIHGHSHTPNKYIVNSNQIVCAPIGNQEEWLGRLPQKELNKRIIVVDIK